MDTLSVTEPRHRSHSFGTSGERDDWAREYDDGSSSIPVRQGPGRQTHPAKNGSGETRVGRERSYSQSLRPDLLLLAKSMEPGQAETLVGRQRSYSQSPQPRQRATRSELLQQRLQEISFDSDTEEGPAADGRVASDMRCLSSGHLDTHKLLRDSSRMRSFSASTYHLPPYEPAMAPFPSHPDEGDDAQYAMRCRQQRTMLRRATVCRRISHFERGPQHTWGREYANFIIILGIIATCFILIRLIAYLLW